MLRKKPLVGGAVALLIAAQWAAGCSNPVPGVGAGDPLATGARPSEAELANSALGTHVSFDLLQAASEEEEGEEEDDDDDEVGAERVLGEPLPGLSASQLAAFERGEEVFETEFDETNGGGPLKNDASCAECHEFGGVGGAGDEHEIRIGVVHDKDDPANLVSGAGFHALEELGGPVKQGRANEGFVVESELTQEKIDALADRLALDGINIGRELITSTRTATMVAGDGLLSTVPDKCLILRAEMPKPFGITGHLNILSGKLGDIDLNGRIGRLGLKAQLPDNQAFAADAALEELGLSNPHLPHENNNNGPRGDVDTPELSADQMKDLMTFCSLLAPPRPKRIDEAGLNAFNKAGCATCHWSGYQTAYQPDQVAPHMRENYETLKWRRVLAFTDLLVHNLGEGLADGFKQGSANGAEWRTAPLWGLRLKETFLHDDRAESLEDAILMHQSKGSEANQVIDNYKGVSTINPAHNLDDTERAALTRFLQGL